MRTSKKFISDVENLDSYDSEDDGFIEGNVSTGKTLASFSFSKCENQKSNVNLPTSKKITNTNPKLVPDPLSFNNTSSSLKVLVDEETFSIKRGYQFKPSTLRKLSEIKSVHPDINVYFSTILDEAILNYYNCFFNNEG